MLKIFPLIICLLSGASGIYAQSILTGQVIDKETKEVLPFAAIGFKNTAIGTVANGSGVYSLKLPQNVKDLTLEISFLGYHSVLINGAELEQQMNFELESSFMQLDELVIRPLSPEDYIRRAVRSIPDNYANLPFETHAYYREKVTENNNFIALNEAYLKSYFPNYQDTVKNQHRLLLYRTAADIQKVQFMKEWTDKKQKKEERKEEKKAAKDRKKNIEVSPEDSVNSVEAGIFTANFGGLDQVFSSDLVKNLEDFLDSTRFKKYNYEFANGVMLSGRDILVINFKSKGVVEHARVEGNIYIDIRSDAIVAVDYNGDGVIPLAIRPIMFAFGISIDDIKVRKMLRYALIEDTWYLKSMKLDAGAYLEKRHIFNKNEKSHFAIDQVFNVNTFGVEQVEPIPENQRYTSEKTIKEQVFSEPGVSWKNVNTLVLEEL